MIKFCYLLLVFIIYLLLEKIIDRKYLRDASNIYKATKLSIIVVLCTITAVLLILIYC